MYMQQINIKFRGTENLFGVGYTIVLSFGFDLLIMLTAAKITAVLLTSNPSAYAVKIILPNKLYVQPRQQLLCGNCCSPV
jgi:hypothetical protein